MWHYKGYDLPADVSLVALAAGKILYYRYRIAVKTPRDLIDSIRGKTSPRSCFRNGGEMARLDKISRAVNFFLIRVLRYPRPCLIRSCILFEQALQSGINAEMIIGVKPEGNGLAGHGWIAIDGRPFREDAATIREYTIMMKG